MTIYYFSGTGNSLHAAKKIAEKVGESKVVNIALVKQEVIEDNCDVIGIVFPVFYADAPNIVKDFVKKLRLDPKAHVFAVATCGGMAGNSFSTIDAILKKNGLRLSAGYTLVMADNAYIGMNLVTPPEERDAVYKASEARLAEIIGSISKREVPQVKYNFNITSSLLGGMSSTWAARIYRLPRRFKSTEKCTGCGICEKLCPTGNITRVDKRVTWGNNCTHCLACFHWCPQMAIGIGTRSSGIARYHHPDIKVADMLK